MEYNHLPDCKHPHAPIDVCGCEVKILKAKVEELKEFIEDQNRVIRVQVNHDDIMGAATQQLAEAQAKVEELEAEIVTLRNFAHGIKQTVELMLMNPPQEGE